MATPAPEVYVGLGSNLGQPRDNLRAGLEGMDRLPGYQRLALSSCYLTAPVGPQDQPPFYNAVARGTYTGQPRALLEGLLKIEAQLGRRRDRHWGPRTLDLDILLFGDMVIEEPDLALPHPEMAGRVFVLAPLAELAPDLALPRWGQTAGQLLARMPAQQRAAQKVEKVAWGF